MISMKWNELKSPDQIDMIREESKSKPVLIFKHSSRCSVSQLTLDRLQRKWSAQASVIKPYFLDLIAFRDISNRVAEQFSVEHESPQVLLIRDGNVIYDRGVTLLDTWRAMESLVDRGRCRAIGLSDIGLHELLPIYESARIKPAVVQVEAHPYLPETELLEFCKDKGVVFLAFAPLGHGLRPGLLEDPVISAIAARVGKTPAQVLLAWAVQRGTALLTTPKTPARARENFNISALPEDAFDEINRIQTRQRLNEVVKTGSPGFIAQGR